jgi:hypothetical protein
MFDLNEETFIMYAIKHYDNKNCSGLGEFFDDLNRFKYLKRLFKKYKADGQLRERLILNHLIVIYNLFGVDAATKLLFFKIEKEYWKELKTFLVFLNYMPRIVIVSRDMHIKENDIQVDDKILDTLKNL